MSAEQKRLEELLAKQEAAVRRAFALFVRSVRSDAEVRRVRDLIEAGRIEDAIGVADRYVVRLAAVVPQVFTASAIAEVEALAAQLGGGGVAITFDPTNARAVSTVRQARLEFIREFTASQREATRTALTEALQAGAGPREAARAFRDSIGLTQHQRAAVANYERLLRDGRSEALSRELRDRRFDGTVQRAVTTGEPLEETQIRRMVDRYRERYLAYRAENIARTETGRVFEEARDEATRQVLDEAGISDDLVERTWRTTRDGRERTTHHALNGQKVIGTNSFFVSPSGARLRRPKDPSAPAKETINCRCVATTRIRQAAEADAA